MQVADINPSKGPSTVGNRRRDAERKPSDGPSYSGPERRTGARSRPGEIQARLEERLEPDDGSHLLLVPVVLFRIQQEFAYMVSDEEVGRIHVEQMKKDIHANTQNMIVRTERLKNLEQVQNQAVYVRFGDNPASETEYLSTVLIPGEPIKINYESAQHGDQSRPLLWRFASMLGYRIVGQESGWAR